MRVVCPNCGHVLDRLPYPPPTVDAILEVEPGKILLVRRRFPPLGWALPGGFVESGESLEDACSREVAEETGIAISDPVQMHSYSDPKRDPRGPTVTTVFVARASGVPRAGDDAAAIGIFALDQLPDPLCFDHAAIIEDFRRARYGIGPAGKGPARR